VVAVTLQAADKDDTATMDKTLIEAGMAVAELAVHEVESRPEDAKVNIRGIEELVADCAFFVSVRSSPLDRLRVPAAEVSTYF
jgi:hypothetical protein